MQKIYKSCEWIPCRFRVGSGFMKKLLGIIVVSLLLSTSAFAFKSLVGKGVITLSDAQFNQFIKYLEHKKSQTFIISIDGRHSNFSICNSFRRCSGGKGGVSRMIKKCKKLTKTKCYIFAKKKKFKKIIRWNEVGYKFDMPQLSFDVKKHTIDREKTIRALKELNFY